MTPQPSLSIGFLGAGRLGNALHWSLARAGFDARCVASRALDDARAMLDRLPDC